MSNAHDYAAANASRFREQLKELVRIPSVSTLPGHAADMHRAAEWIVNEMRRIGLPHAELLRTPGNSVVYGEWLGAGENSPTVLIYGHYDVQPAAVEDGWDSDPFEPVERDGKIYARGVTDNKGQFFAHLKGVESLLTAEGRLPANVKFMIEGEEEVSGDNLSKLVADERARFKADVCLISDGGMPQYGVPAITYALRGIMAMELIVSGPATDLHSGRFGGTVHNPLQALAEIIAQLHAPDGSVAVPDFYDDVLPLDAEERAVLAKSGTTEDRWRSDTGAPQPWGEAGYTLEERIGARPTLEINGMAGGFSGPGFKTVLPAKAMAKISCRLVPHQDPDSIFKLVSERIRHIAPPTVQVECRPHSGGRPVLVNRDTPFMQAASRAYEKVWGVKPVFNRAGGSIPVVADVQQVLGLPVILMSLGLHSDLAHGPNEHLLIECFEKGIDTSIYALHEFGRL